MADPSTTLIGKGSGRTPLIVAKKHSASISSKFKPVTIACADVSSAIYLRANRMQ